MAEDQPRFGKFSRDGRIVERGEISSTAPGIPVSSTTPMPPASVSGPAPTPAASPHPPASTPMVPVVDRTPATGTPWPTSPPVLAPRPGTAAAQSTNGFAIAALVLGIFGGSVLALTFGFIAKSQINNSGGTQKGDGLATAGITLGILWLLIQILFWAALFSATSSY